MSSVDEAKPSFTRTLETPVEELMRGTLFAERYEIIEELGKGGMGAVYRVEDTKAKEEIALKLIRPEIAADKKTIERFRNELTTARKISHRNVCRMFDLGEENGVHFITMEYVPGEDLKSLIKRVKIDIETSLELAKQICEGLSEAHRLGVVHRDLKPSNIMIDKEGNARIVDFGIARSHSSKDITGAGVIIGTPEYMSPEQVETKEVDQRSDIYSLGVILYEMMTGRIPFEADSPYAISVMHKSEIPKDPMEHNAQIPQDVNRAILRCLEKDKEKRFQSTDELHSELMRIGRATPSSEIEIPKQKPLFLILIILACVTIALVVWKPWSQNEAISALSSKPSLAVMYFKNNTGDENLEHWRSMLADLFIADLTQSRYVDVLSGERLFQILNELNQLEAKSYSSEVLDQVAAKAGVNHILVGNYAKAGDTIRINVTLQDAHAGTTVSSEGVEGEGEESIFPMVDELTKKIKMNFRVSPEALSNDMDREVGEITTSSPQAMKYYIEGQKYHYKEEYRRSIALMEKAVEVDPEFAMAFRSMADNYGNLYLFSERNKYINKALEYSDRLSERERFLITGDYYKDSEATFEKAIEAYKKLIALYPKDALGNIYLGDMYYNSEEFDKAIKRYEIAASNQAAPYLPNVSLAYCYNAKGMYERSKEVLRGYLDSFPENAGIHQALASSYMLQGEFQHAMSEAEEAFILEPENYMNFIRKGDIHLYQGNFIRAEEEFRKMLNTREPVGQGWGMWRLARLHQLQGRFEKAKDLFLQGVEHSKKTGQKRWEAWNLWRAGEIDLASGNPIETLEECERAINIAKKNEYLTTLCSCLHLTGQALINIKSPEEARGAANELKKLTQVAIQKTAQRFYYHLMGLLELESGNILKAIEDFDAALAMEPSQHAFAEWPQSHALLIDAIALAYYKAGDLQKAQEEYEKITKLTAGRLCFGHLYAKSYFMLGKINEMRDNKFEAIEHYEKFLDLWKDADPGITEVEDARERLAGLKN